jgi:hypothetical protein
MTPQPIDYASGPQANSRFGWLGAACLFLSLAGIVLGLGLFSIGSLVGFGARGGGPGIPIAAAGLILGPLLNLVGFVMGVVALFRKGPHRMMAVIGVAISGITVLALLALVVGLAV